MGLPIPDEIAYDGDIVIRTQTYGKSKTTKASGLDKVRKAIVTLEDESNKRLTLDRIDLSPEFITKIKTLFDGNPSPIDFQIFINKEISADLRKVTLQLKTFLQNNH